MENLDKNKIEQIVKTRKKAHAYYLKNSKVYQAFVDMEQKTYQDGNLSKKQKELIALGIGVAQRCEPCILLHVRKCLDAGATPEEIIEAAGVSVMMQGGPGYTHLPLVIQALEELAPSV